MNFTCAHCQHVLTPQRRVAEREILCPPCENTWWNRYKAVYEAKIKEWLERNK